MNTFLQDNLFAIILFLLFIILLLIAFIGVVLVKILLSNKNTPAAPNPAVQALYPDKEKVVLVPVVETTATFKKLSEEKVVEKYYCENHPDIPSVGSCLICEDVFCENCLIEHDGLYFCKEHFRTFANNKWKQITDVMTTPNTPEDGLYIYHYKRHIWKDKKIPSFVLTHYKINIEQDFIESFIQLNVVEEKAEELLEDIQRFKAKH